MRLGRGGGSYDRALARVGPAILTMALVYDSRAASTTCPPSRTTGRYARP